MKVPRQVCLKHLAIIVVSTILLTSFAFYVFAATPTSTFWISSGVYPGAPTYTIWREGSDYFAKDANGEIKYSGTNATEVIEDAIDNAPDWGSVKALGTITIENTIEIVNRRGFTFEFETINVDADVDGISVHSPYDYTSNRVIGGYIYTASGYTQAVISIRATNTVVNVDHIYIVGTGRGVEIIADDTDSAAYFNKIYVNRIVGAEVGVYLGAGSGDTIAYNEIQVGMINDPAANFTGVRFLRSGTGILSMNTVYRTLIEMGGTGQNRGFQNNARNTLLECSTVDCTADDKSILNEAATGSILTRLRIIGGTYDHNYIQNTGNASITWTNVIFLNDYLSEDRDNFASLSNGTWVTHDLGLAPNLHFVTLHANSGYAWIGEWNATHIRIYMSIATGSGSWQVFYDPLVA